MTLQQILYGTFTPPAVCRTRTHTISDSIVRIRKHPVDGEVKACVSDLVLNAIQGMNKCCSFQDILNNTPELTAKQISHCLRNLSISKKIVRHPHPSRTQVSFLYEVAK